MSVNMHDFCIYMLNFALLGTPLENKSTVEELDFVLPETAAPETHPLNLGPPIFPELRWAKTIFSLPP